MLIVKAIITQIGETGEETFPKLQTIFRSVRNKDFALNPGFTRLSKALCSRFEFYDEASCRSIFKTTLSYNVVIVKLAISESENLLRCLDFS